MDPFLAQIVMFGGNFAPRGWAFCEGQLLPISQYQAVFSLLGTTYGGDGRTTFALPDLRGRVPVHPGTGPGLTTRRIGERSGTEMNTLNILNLPSHNHTAVVNAGAAKLNVSSSVGDHQVPASGDSLAATGIPAGRGTDPANSYINAAPNVTLNDASLNLAGVSITIGNTGGQQPVNNMQPWLGVNYIIALEGTFPSRS